MFLVKKTLQNKCGFEGLISNVDLGLFQQKKKQGLVLRHFGFVKSLE